MPSVTTLRPLHDLSMSTEAVRASYAELQVADLRVADLRVAQLRVAELRVHSWEVQS